MNRTKSFHNSLQRYIVVAVYYSVWSLVYLNGVSMLVAVYYVLSALLVCTCADASRILLVPGNAYSHLTFFGRLGKILVESGHDVTSAHASSMPLPKFYTEAGMTIERYHVDNTPFILQDETVDIVLNWGFNYSIQTMLNILEYNMENFEKESEHMLKDSSFMKRMATSQFDLAIVDTFPSFSAIAYKLSIPYIVFGTQCSPSEFHSGYNPAIIPHLFVDYDVPMNLINRVRNYLFYMFESFGQTAAPNRLVKQYITEKPVKSYSELTENAAMCFQLRDSAILSFQAPVVPNTVDLAGIIVKPTKALPKEFSDILNSGRAKDGVVLVTFGSWINKLPQKTMRMLMESFEKLPFLFIFKYNRKITTKIPSNVLVFDWVPQNDILGHASVKLSINHCGVSSVTEAISHGVPILAMPLYYDQYHTAASVRARGFGVIVNIARFTPDELGHMVTHVIETPKYKMNAMKASLMMKEKEDFSPTRKRAIFWIEHIIKHGSSHLRPEGLDLPWYSRHLLDVKLCFFIFAFVVSSVFYLATIFVYRIIVNGLRKVKSKND